MHTFFVGLQLFTIVLSIIALVLIINQNATNMQQMMVSFLICTVIQNAGYLFELQATGEEAALLAVKMQYMGSCWTTLFYCRFIFFYSGLGERRALFHGMALLNAILMCAVWTCESNSLFYRTRSFVTESNGFSHLVFGYGWMFYVFLIGCCFLPFLLSFLALFYAYRREKALQRKRNIYNMLFLSSVPMLTLILYVFGTIRTYDPCPAITGILMAMVVIVVWRKQDYDFSQAAAHTLLSELDDCIILLNQFENVMNYNPAAARIFITLNSESIGKSIRLIEDFPMDLISAEGKCEFELHGGYFEGHCKGVYDRQGVLRGYAITVFDITSKQTYIEEIEEMRKRAEAASHAKSEFLANMSHEIRTPMNAIMGMSELIMEESRGRKVYEYARDIKVSSKNLLKVINNILDISDVDVGRAAIDVKEYDLAKLLQDMESISGMNAKQNGLEFRMKINQQLPCKFIGDEKRIRQILQNLLDNAIKYTKEGSVSLAVNGQQMKGNQWNLSFSVTDTGIGIHQKDIEKIFENFQQVDTSQIRQEEGAGLGLSISRKLARLMNGDIEVESSVGAGSVFTFSLSQEAAVTGTIQEQGLNQQEEPMFVAHECKILIVDDNMINRKVAIGMLKPYGCSVTGAESGFEAIDLVQRNSFDIIFMDHMMPGMDGVETVRLIRKDCGENGRKAVIIALTANALDGVKEMFLTNGFQDFLSKPIDRLPLHHIMTRWVPQEYREYETSEKAPTVANISLGDLEEIIVKGIDIKKVIEYHTGTLDEYVELLSLYYMDGLKKAAFLRELAEQEDIKNYKIEVHALKSASANIGAMELSEKALEHENAANDGNLAFILENLDDLVTTYRNLLKEIHRVLDRRGMKNKAANGPLESISMETLADGVREALNLVEHFKSKPCAEKVEWLLQHELQDDVRTCLEAVQMKLKMYDDDEAEDMLRELVQSLASTQDVEEK